MQTRKHPRTMRDAFGPYTDNNLHPMPGNEDRYVWADKALYLVGIVAVMLIIFTL